MESVVQFDYTELILKGAMSSSKGAMSSSKGAMSSSNGAELTLIKIG